jgi:5-methylcytosine-specific restriction endonuclease McrA
MLETRICPRCKQEKPLTNEYFGKSSVNKNGFRTQCLECARIMCLDYAEKHRKRLLENATKYYQEHKEEKKIYNKKYQSANGKKYRKEHKETIALSSKKYYLKNKDKYNEYSKKWKNEHKDKAKFSCLKYRKAHMEKVYNWNNARRSRKNCLESSLTNEQWEEIKLHFDNKCAYCGKEESLTREHFIPLSKGGEYTINNIIPVCKSCNSSKLDKDFFEWYPKYRYYSKKRENKILRYLNYKNNKTQQLTLIV